MTEHITKITAVSPSDAPCPLWTKFLGEITGGDGELQAYLQRVAGYALTGSTREDVIFFVYGPAANGNCVFFNTLGLILGDYGIVAPLMFRPLGRRELAHLRDARAVIATAMNENRRWTDKQVMALTIGNRFAHGRVRPQSKFFIGSEMPPNLSGISESLRRHCHVIPFTVVIPEEARDVNLMEKLRLEWSAILQWAIDGCAAWMENGLAPPEIVLKATEEAASAV